jgi:hypothetical protein
LGARSLKPGHTRFFVGYKKHTLRLWIGGFEPFVLLAPLVTWAAPASVPEGYLLKPSVKYCIQRLDFRPDVVVGDMGYIHHATKRELRVEWRVAMLTKLKADMKARCDYAEDQPLRCPQGQELTWLGYDEEEYQHWFAPPSQPRLCSSCWEQSRCPRQFAVPADRHETFFGMIPLNTILAQRLIRSVRSWIEPSQSFEKNQLGLKTMFLNSLRLCWTTSLLADSAALLRVLAILKDPPAKPLLHELFPTQTQFQLE